MQTRISYHTSVKYLYRKGLEKVLPISLKARIPRSNIHRWRNETDDKYLGCNLNSVCNEKLELLQSFARHREAQQTFRAYMRLFLVFQTIAFGLKRLPGLLRQSQDQIVEAVERVSSVIKPEKALRIFNVSRSTYQDWKIRVQFPCPESFQFLCLKRRPNQATKGEVSKIKNLLIDSTFSHWPICSVAWYALREGIVSLSLGSWYKYNQLLGIRRALVKKRDRNSVGLQASKPNEYWHLDVTIFKTLEGVKYYIHILMDNYSRKIIAWRLADKLSAERTIEVLEEAFKALGDKITEVIPSLIVDGGSENNAAVVEDKLAGKIPPIQKLIAQSDILQSNSMVEAVNKILKYQYLYRQPIEDGVKLRGLLENAIREYNEVRPHGQLKGLTPFEAYSGMEVKDLRVSEKLAEARQIRVERNRKWNCRKCE